MIKIYTVKNEVLFDCSEDTMKAAVVLAHHDGVSLRYARLADQDLSDASLSGIDFSHADLRGTNFAGSDLDGAKFCDATLYNTNFKGCLLLDTVFSGKLIECDFTNTQLASACFDSVRFKRCCFIGAEVQVVNADGEGTVWDISGAEFKECDLTGCDKFDTQYSYFILCKF